MVLQVQHNVWQQVFHGYGLGRGSAYHLHVSKFKPVLAFLYFNQNSKLPNDFIIQVLRFFTLEFHSLTTETIFWYLGFSLYKIGKY